MNNSIRRLGIILSDIIRAKTRDVIFCIELGHSETFSLADIVKYRLLLFEECLDLLEKVLNVFNNWRRWMKVI